MNFRKCCNNSQLFFSCRTRSVDSSSSVAEEVSQSCDIQTICDNKQVPVPEKNEFLNDKKGFFVLHITYIHNSPSNGIQTICDNKQVKQCNKT